MMVAMPLPGGADQVREGVPELDFGGRVGAVADLVLEPLQVERIARPVGQRARHQEAGHPVVEPCERKEAVAHRRRAEPLVSGKEIAAVNRRRDAAVGTQVRAALFLGHRHADRGAVFLRDRQRARVVGVRGELGLPHAGECRRVAPQNLDAGEGHGDRARDALFALVPQVIQGRARCEGTFLAGGPCEGMQAGAECERHQLVVCGMEFHCVDAMAEAVVRPEHRPVAVCLVRKDLHALRTDEFAHRCRIALDPAGLRAFRRGDQDAVLRPGVVAGERRRLVGDLVRRVGRGEFHRLDACCGISSARRCSSNFERSRGRSSAGVSRPASVNWRALRLSSSRRCCSCDVSSSALRRTSPGGICNSLSLPLFLHLRV